jgi:hypothetical protein
MRTHDVLERMCALAASGQLDADESLDFEVHLLACESCRADLEAYRTIVKEMGELPVVDPSGIVNDGKSAASFLSRLGAEEIHTSAAARDFLLGRRSSGWLVPTMTFGSIAVVAVLVAVTLPKIVASRQPAVPPSALATIEQGEQANQALRQRLQSDRQIIASVQKERDDARSELQRVGEGESPLSELKRQLGDAIRQEAKLRADLQDRDDKIASISGQAQDKERQLASLQARVNALEESVQRTDADMVTARMEVVSLQDQLQGEKLTVEQEKQLNTVAKDVRELMGARRLFMIDVYDGENLSTAQRSFGRVFYTQGHSLIFYAFDLDQHRNIHKVSFQAWGEKGKNPASVKPLGVFQVDDVAQRRWVMKVDDPEKLKTIDAVFVTVESSRNPARPSGQKLLYAFLGGQPNHP